MNRFSEGVSGKLKKSVKYVCNKKRRQKRTNHVR